MTYCTHCGSQTGDDCTLCPECELRFGLLLLRLSNDVAPLHDSLDATLHPGGHSPTRIILATPQTPIRLDVLDLIDILDSTAAELLRRLDGVDALEPRYPSKLSLRDMLQHCAEHTWLPHLADSSMYLDTLTRLATQIDRVLDPPEQRREIGVCELCATPLTAGMQDQWATCPTCGREQRVLTVKLHRLSTLCFDQTKTGTASQIAKAFTDSGIHLTRKRITKWADRGSIEPADGKGGKRRYLYSDVYRLTLAPNNSTFPSVSDLQKTLVSPTIAVGEVDEKPNCS